jgi:hypothetical protein
MFTIRAGLVQTGSAPHFAAASMERAWHHRHAGATRIADEKLALPRRGYCTSATDWLVRPVYCPVGSLLQ